MQYQVSRNGQMYGPYTLDDLQRYVTSGNVLPTDLAKTDDMTEWLPVSRILGGPAAATDPAAGFSNPSYASPAAPTPNYGAPQAFNPYAPNPALANSTYPDPPNLHWGLVLLFSVLTCSLFMFIWNLIIASWLKKVQPNATSLMWYIGGAVLAVIQLIGKIATPGHAGDGESHVGSVAILGLLGLGTWVVRLIARFSQRSSLEEHFNGPEPVGLQLNPVMVFFFGGLYFQAELNRINELKKTARMSVGRM